MAMTVYGLGTHDNYPLFTTWRKPPWEIDPYEDMEEEDGEERFDDRIEPWEIEEMLGE